MSEFRSTNEKTYGICKTISFKLTDKLNEYDNRVFVFITSY